MSNCCNFNCINGLPAFGTGSRCGNLLENPSFEIDFHGWETNNVGLSGEDPFEGAVTARMSSGISSMFQDVLLDLLSRKPLLLSFEIFYPLASDINPTVGHLLIEVLWLDCNKQVVGTGLRNLIPARRTSDDSSRLTFVEVTETLPVNAVMARLQFTKGAIEDNTKNILELDNVILAPIDSSNLVKNSGFQLGLANWNSTSAFLENFDIYEGTAAIDLGTGSTISQNVPLSFPNINSNFLLSFAVKSVPDAFPLLFFTAEVIWLDFLGNLIGTGLELQISKDAVDQSNYITYVDVTNKAPFNATTAQIIFSNKTVDASFTIDKVIFAKVRSGNLLENPSFENPGSISPWVVRNTSISMNDSAYEGRQEARFDLGVGGSIFQIVPVQQGNCYLLNFGYKHVDNRDEGEFLAEVYWLNSNGEEIGVGLVMAIVTQVPLFDKWCTYIGVTDIAHLNATSARVQFSKSGGSRAAIDKVVFARLV